MRQQWDWGLRENGDGCRVALHTPLTWPEEPEHNVVAGNYCGGLSGLMLRQYAWRRKFTYRSQLPIRGEASCARPIQLRAWLRNQIRRPRSSRKSTRSPARPSDWAPSVNKTPASGSQRGQSHAPFQRLAAGGVGWPRSGPTVVRLSKCYIVSGASGIRANPQNGAISLLAGTLNSAAAFAAFCIARASFSASPAVVLALTDRWHEHCQ
jgi:hypothetical protein